ncbi:MAG: prealbumin-like fold domain-containing protein, partial [Thermoproteota archaeon]|nr:prealbumin-like fold domain-containing protein [Thermoproteota archaeon]
MSSHRLAVIASIVAAAATISAVFLVLQSQNLLTIFAASSSSSNAGSLTIISVPGSLLTNRSTYVISPDPFDNFANYTIHDGSSADKNNAAGIVEISGLPEGQYVVTQIEASSQYETDKISKTVEIMNESRSGVAIFNNFAWQEGGEQQQHQEVQNRTSPIRNLTYYVKFECGTISGDEGPLRPGHYDTDIGILNKQDFATQIQWSVTANNSRNTNSIIRTLEPQGSTNIVCKDLQNIIGSEQRFVEGFVIINLPLEPGVLASLSDGAQVLGRSLEDLDNLLEVQAFYTANALDELPHEVLVDKIIFAIVNDTSGKIPLEMMNKTLDITVPSSLNEISDPEIKVRELLAEKYGLSNLELANLQIEIMSVSGSVGTMIDDHAISLSTIMP